MAVYGVNNMYNMYNTSLRFTGLATGIDTDQVVQSMMLLEKARINSIIQQKQLAEWKQSAYREFINLLRAIKSEYMDILKPSTNMLSQSSYKKFKVSVINSVNGTASTLVSASGTANAMAGTYKIKVLQRATAGYVKSSEAVTKLESGVLEEYDEETANSIIGGTFKISLDGQMKKFTIGNFTSGDYEGSGWEALANHLKELINDAEYGFGSGSVDVKLENGKLVFTTKGNIGNISIHSGGENDVIDKLKFTDGASTGFRLSDTLEQAAAKMRTPWDLNSGKLKFKINGQSFEFSKDTTLSSMMNTINANEKANVIMRYDETTDRFIITSKTTGSSSTVEIEDVDELNFLEAIGLFIKDENGENKINYTEGQDAQVIIDGQKLTRSSNTFTVNGVTYTLLRDPTEDEKNIQQEINLDIDVDAIYDNIKGFIDKYNELIDKINNAISERRNRNYLPLTDEQKEVMNEKDIEKWEAEAKKGLLYNDSLLQNIVTNMRRALFDPIEGLNINLSSIGITTGYYTEKGKLNIDETKLKEAIRNTPDLVMDLFSKKSVSQPSYTRTLTQEERSVRYKEQGLIQRLYDIIEDNISTFTDNNGKKGLLLEKAGIEGDRSYINNALYKEIQDYNKKIDSMWEVYYRKEDALYKKFAALEKAMSQLNSQTTSLLAQLGMSGK
ncbi:MAG: flagellar filament capping protein FliD [Clostridiaceae bacterium]|nr:flagellar filament capping protein FliD [Clostridiaceae bacterium]